MQHGPQIKAALQSDGSYNYDECFARIRPEVERADVAIANFEVTLGGKPYTGYPQFRAPDEYLQAVVDAGFDVLLTANNHCVDSHRAGLERTILMMDSLHVPHLGTYVDQQSRDLTYPFLLERNGLRIALLNFTYGTNGLPVEHPNIVNLIDTLQLRADIAKARQMQPDAIIALPHWGIEYQQLPSAEQRSLAQWLIDNGVDHVIGGHPHVAQPLELSADSCHLIAWSMGNVISNQSRANTYGGYFVRLDITRRDTLTTTLTEGIDLDAGTLAEALEGAKILVTFNGSCFDVPVLRNSFPEVDFDLPHYDLRFASKKVGYRGGLKPLEIEMGITREDEIEGVDGAMAVRLWHQWERHQDKDALDILTEYNRADTVNLETIAERIYKRLVTDYAGYRW